MTLFLRANRLLNRFFFALLAGAWLLALGAQAATPPLRLVPRQQLQAGTGQSLLLRADGTLYTWSATSAPVSMALPAGVRLVQLAAGTTHTLALASDGTAYAWGSNDYGQLGIGNFGRPTTPTAVAMPAGVRFVQLAAGSEHSLALADDGTLYAWGNNQYGELGNNKAVGQATQPTPVVTTARFTQVAAGARFSLALADDGHAYAWGVNNLGQLGDGTTLNRSLPVSVRQPSGLYLTQLAAGALHCLALAADGTAYAWGNNQNGELGDGTTTTRTAPSAVVLPAGRRLVQVASYSFASHSVALADDGTPYAWGLNNAGQLGDGTTTNRATPAAVPLPAGVRLAQVAAGYPQSVGLAASGAVYTWGTSAAAATPTLVPVPNSPVSYTQAVRGSFHGLGLRADGLAYAWGSNTYGELGSGALTSARPVPAAVALPTGVRLVQGAAGSSTSFGLAADGTTYAWGTNDYGQLGTGTTTQTATPSVVALPTGQHLVQVAAGPLHTLGLAADGTVYAWGLNSNAQLGNSSLQNQVSPVAVPFPAGVQVVQLAAGRDCSVACTADGLVYVWGGGSFGEYGDGTTGGARATPTLVALPVEVHVAQVAVGEHFCLALATTGTVYAWGDNTRGQLGDGTFTRRLLPVPVAMPTGVRFRQLAAGNNHALGLGADGGIYGWGADSDGQLGINKAGGDFYGQPTREASGLSTWTALALGTRGDYSLVLGPGGYLYSTGLNTTAQLGDGTTTLARTFVRNLAPLPTLAAAGALALDAQVVPNPSAGVVTIQATAAQAGPATFTLLDALGRLCLRHAAPLPAGASQVALPGAEALAPGFYLLRVQQGSQQASARLVRE